VAHFDYRLTDKGRDGIRFLDAKYPAESSLVRSAIREVQREGSIDYIELSLAAKAAWVLENHGMTLDPNKIMNVAGRFGWPVSAKQVERAAEFLSKLDLVVVG